MCQIFVADEPDHAVKLLVGRRFELFGHVGDAVGIVPRVADDERIFTQLLPASRQRGDGRRIARPFEEGTAGDRQRGFLVQEIDRRRGCQDIMALVIARKGSRSTSKLRSSRTRCMQKCAAFPQPHSWHENTFSA